MSKLATPTSSVTAQTRRTIAALVASALVVIAFATARGSTGVSSPKAARPAPTRAARPQVRREATSVSPEGAARIFVSSYVSFLYGRGVAAAVTPVDAGLYHQLLGARSTPTPAELARALVVRDLRVRPDNNVTAIATAVVDDGASPPYALSFDLSFSHRRWVVTGVHKGER